jgi:hypothetical protein
LEKKAITFFKVFPAPQFNARKSNGIKERPKTLDAPTISFDGLRGASQPAQLTRTSRLLAVLALTIMIYDAIIRLTIDDVRASDR